MALGIETHPYNESPNIVDFPLGKSHCQQIQVYGQLISYNYQATSTMINHNHELIGGLQLISTINHN
jgi:hypothetical protein